MAAHGASAGSRVPQSPLCQVMPGYSLQRGPPEYPESPGSPRPPGFPGSPATYDIV